MDSHALLLRQHQWDGSPPVETDQSKGLPQPPLQKPYPADAKLVDLVPPDDLTLGTMPLIEAIRRRRSRRKFTDDPITLEELSFLLWTTQGVEELIGRSGRATLRTVPSAGARHAFETYLSAHRVDGLPEGLYRYLALEHKLCLVATGDGLAANARGACLGQKFVEQSAVTFIWTVVPYRMEWRYVRGSHKIIALDAGHVCQNLYLAAESIGCGTCAIGAYDQDAMDELVGVDGESEFVLYVAPVGRLE
jgi:SagB-type dehydrogenase family enzyme